MSELYLNLLKGNKCFLKLYQDLQFFFSSFFYTLLSRDMSGLRMTELNKMHVL